MSYLSTSTREVPLSFRLLAMFGSNSGVFGWLLFAIGMMFFWVFGNQPDSNSFKYGGPVVKTSGRLISIGSTSYRDNGEPVYTCTHEYVDRHGHTRTVKSYCKTRLHTNSKANPGSPVRRPEILCVRGVQTVNLSPWAALIAIVPLAGLITAGIAIKNGIHIIHLSRNGRLTYATLKSMDKTGIQINDRYVYKATFSFMADDGREYETVIKTTDTDRITDESQEPLIYDPKQPSAALAVNVLPGQPTLDAGSNLNFHWSLPYRAFALMLLPVLILGYHGLTAYMLFTQ